MDALWFTQKFEYSNFFTQNLSVIVDAFFTQIFELKVRKLFLQCVSCRMRKQKTDSAIKCFSLIAWGMAVENEVRTKI